jgi:tuftelin-interacting protein 11
MSFLEAVCAEVYLPSFKEAIITTWHVRDPELLVQVLDSWATFLPWKIKQELLETILSRLQNTVDEWNPILEKIPICVWVHPWLLMMRDRLRTVWPSIRHKLAMAIQEWNILDRSIFVMLRPWKPIWGEEDWDKFCAKHIIPKLATQFEINTVEQHFKILNSVMIWHGTLSKSLLVHVLNVAIFPKLHQVLHLWLSHEPSLNDINQWYTKWTELFPSDLLEQKKIRFHLTHTLNAINTARKGKYMCQRICTAPWRLEKSNVLFQFEEKANFSEVESNGLSFKTLIEHFAQVNGLVFLPKAKTKLDGRQVYRLGNVSVVLDFTNNVLFIQTLYQRWVPMSLKGVLAEHFIKM